MSEEDDKFVEDVKKFARGVNDSMNKLSDKFDKLAIAAVRLGEAFDTGLAAAKRDWENEGGRYRQEREENPDS